jgi:nitrogen fixation protein NifB
VSRGVLKVSEAVETVSRALMLCPEITVVGIAGPGDALASPNAINAFREIHRAYPEMILCLSTNGLNLTGKTDLLKEVGVRTLTVTVNAVDPEITAKIVSFIVFDGKTYRGEEGGRILIENQLRGIREASEVGIAVKVNTVFIPTVNDRHIVDIANAAKKAGASFHNIIPLIPQGEFKNLPEPTCLEIHQAREQAEEHLRQFRHCQHCRADACGIIGKEDLSEKLYGGRELETFSHG